MRKCVMAGMVVTLLICIASTSLAADIYVPRVEENGRLLVPLRGIFEHFGAEVGWDQYVREITVTGGTYSILMYVNDYTAQINGRNYSMSVPPRVYGSRTYVPLRFVGEAMGVGVEYRGSYVDIIDGADVLRVHLEGSQGGPSGGRQNGGGSGYLLSGSNTRSLNSGDLSGRSNWQLTLMRNEIYARHGRPFNNSYIRSYFKSQSWYRANSNFRESWLSKLEQNNAAYIASYQKNVFGTAATKP